MKKLVFLILTVSILLFSCAQDKDTNQLVIYTYDSFTADWGPGPKIIEKFEAKYGITVDLQSVGDGQQIAQRAYLERKNPQADILLGIDNNMLAEVLSKNLLEPYKSALKKVIPEELYFDSSNHIIPFDYGYFSINYNSSKITNPPQSLEDLTKAEYKKSIILMDPRTSTPGLGFLLWIISVYGDDFDEYWGRLQPSILTITDSWSSGYGMYTDGEAPMVLSYTSSPPYHVQNEGTEQYKAAMFKEGHYLQIEGMGIVKGSANRKNAKLFIDFMLTLEVQEILPLTQYMYPINPKAALPASFDFAPKTEKTLNFDTELIAEKYDEWIEKWLNAASK